MLEKFDDIIVKIADIGMVLSFNPISTNNTMAKYHDAYGPRAKWEFICGRYKITALITEDKIKEHPLKIMNEIIDAVVNNENCHDSYSVRMAWTNYVRANNLYTNADQTNQLAAAINKFADELASATRRSRAAFYPRPSRKKVDTSDDTVEDATEDTVEDATVEPENVDAATAAVIEAEKTRADAAEKEAAELRKHIAEMQKQIDDLQQQKKK